jgi:hypothetical protein
MSEHSCLQASGEALALGGSMYMGMQSLINNIDDIGELWPSLVDYVAKTAIMGFNIAECVLHDPWISND